MIKVTITPDNSGSACGSFRAAGRGLESVGTTPGAALDSLARQLTPEEANTLIVVQNMHPDEFFTAGQQRRLRELLDRRRLAIDAGQTMSVPDKDELEALIDAELEGVTRRAAAIVNELQS